jgi:hypothetical protein
MLEVATRKKFFRLLPKEELKGCLSNSPSKLKTAFTAWSDPNHPIALCLTGAVYGV